MCFSFIETYKPPRWQSYIKKEVSIAVPNGKIHKNIKNQDLNNFLPETLT